MTGSTPAPQASVLLPPKCCMFSAMLKPRVPHRDASCSGIWGSGISLALLWVDVSAPAWSVVSAGCVWLRGGCTRGGCGSFVPAALGSCLHPADTQQVCLSQRQQWQGWGWVACKSPNLIIPEVFPCECWVIRTGGEQHRILETCGLVACSRQTEDSVPEAADAESPTSIAPSRRSETDGHHRWTDSCRLLLAWGMLLPQQSKDLGAGCAQETFRAFFLGGGGGFFW